jgi:hypothetical protein
MNQNPGRLYKTAAFAALGALLFGGPANGDDRMPAIPSKQVPIAVVASAQTEAGSFAACACPRCGGRCNPYNPSMTLDQLVRLAPEQLDSLYANASAPPVLDGKVRGRVVVWPGSRLAGPASRAAWVIWQGKVFQNCGTSAVNKFFGIRIIRANVYHAESWRDGGPALVLDYSQTSRLYARYRDEIREVAPGLYLGLMYERTCPEPKLKTYFALEARPCD